MAVSRCPRCNQALTDEEASAPACPVCAAPFAREEATPSPPPAPATQPLPWAWLAVTLPAYLLIVGYLLRLLVMPQEKPETPTPPPDERKAAKVQKKPKASKVIAKAPPAERKPSEKVVKPPEPKMPVPMPDPPAPPAPYLLFVADDAIKLDGDLADWKGIPVIKLAAVERGRPTRKTVAAPRTIDARLAWCRKGLLIAVTAVDTSGTLENAPPPKTGMWPFWDNDCVEIYLDTLNSGSRHRGEPNTHQFFVLPFGTTTDGGASGFESKMSTAGGKLKWAIVPHPAAGQKAISRSAKKTPDGWTMEALISPSALRRGDLVPGHGMSVEVQVDTGTNVFYHWACLDGHTKASDRPDHWREVILAGSDAKVELLGSDGKPANSIEPGNVLTARVTDADANLSPLIQEKLSVNLRCGSEVRALTLEETGLDTGVFVGAVPTHSQADERQDRSFGLKPGRELVVEYIDRVRANGHRDVPVRATFAVAK